MRAPDIQHVKVKHGRCPHCGHYGDDCTGEQYPECARLASVREFSQAMGEFFSWLTCEKDFTLCKTDKHDQFYPARASVEELLAEYFEIDLKKVEREKREILASLRVDSARRDIEKDLGLEASR